MTRIHYVFLSLLLAACASAPAPSRPTALRPTDAPGAPARPLGPAWVALAAQSVPPPIVDVAALSDREAVFLARGGIYRWNGADAPTPVCSVGDTRMLAIQAHGSRFVALGGTEGSPLLWRSEDRGLHCETSALPSLSVMGHSPGALRLSLDGAVALVWSTSGLALRSDDGGARWRPLPRVNNALEMASGPERSTLAAVGTSLFTVGRPMRAALYQLSAAPDATWNLCPSAGSRRMPIGFQTLPDGAVRVADALGVFTLAHYGTVTARRDLAEFVDDRAAPVIITAAADGSFFATTSGPLTVIDDQGARAFAWPAGLHPMPTDGRVSSDPRSRRAIDAARDGTVWVTDGLGVWRGVLGGAVTELTERPLDGLPAVMAARGETLAMASPSAQVAVSRDGGARWQRLPVPPGVSTPRAMAIGARGEVLVLTTQGLLVCEAAGLSVLPLPERVTRGSVRPALGVHGDRWELIDGEVWTTDDQGAHWTSRFRPESPSGATAVVSAAVHPRDGVLLIDQSQTLWQSADAATSFTRWVADPFNGQGVGPDAHVGRMLSATTHAPSIAWDGASEAWLMTPVRVSHTANAGASFEVDNSALSPASSYRSPDGHRFVVAVPSDGHLAPCPTFSSSAYLMVSRGDGYVPVSEACAHRASAWAFDGDRVYLVDPVGSVTRGTLSTLGALSESDVF